jgi:hypothetical protein
MLFKVAARLSGRLVVVFVLVLSGFGTERIAAGNAGEAQCAPGAAKHDRCTPGGTSTGQPAAGGTTVTPSTGTTRTVGTTTTAPSTTSTTSATTTATTPTNGACTISASPASVVATVNGASPGTTVCLVNGTYPTISITAPGITIQPASGAAPVVAGYLEVKAPAHDVRVTGLTIDGSSTPQQTVQVWADNFTLDHSTVTNHYKGGSCLNLGSSTYGIDHNTVIDHNTLYDCGLNYGFDHGIYDDYSVDAQITNNYIIAPKAFGIQFWPHAQGTLFAHNVVDGNLSMSGLTFSGSGSPPSNNNVVRYNIFSNSAGYGIDAYWESTVGTGNEADHNCFWKIAAGNYGSTTGYTRGGGDVTANPLYVNAAAGNYALQAGSPCAAMGPA